jgi:hypothetical protein
MKSRTCIAQGDVLLIRADASAVTKEHRDVARDGHGCLVLALGESSGHRHVFRDRNVCMLSREGVGDRVLTLIDPCTLLHDQGAGTYVPTGDHAPVVVPAGTWIVRLQRQWTGEGVANAHD